MKGQTVTLLVTSSLAFLLSCQPEVTLDMSLEDYDNVTLSGMSRIEKSLSRLDLCALRAADSKLRRNKNDVVLASKTLHQVIVEFRPYCVEHLRQLDSFPHIEIGPAEDPFAR
jgi:hypothetical protein